MRYEDERDVTPQARCYVASAVDARSGAQAQSDAVTARKMDIVILLSDAAAVRACAIAMLVDSRALRDAESVYRYDVITLLTLY